MPEYTLTVTFVDSYGREGRKMFTSVPTIADEATAITSAGVLLTALANAMEADILRYTLSRETVYADTLDAGANVDEGGIFTLRKEDTKKGALRIPSPVNAMFNADGSLDLTSAIVTSLATEFFTGSDWTFSDGEQATALVSGYIERA